MSQISQILSAENCYVFRKICCHLRSFSAKFVSIYALFSAKFGFVAIYALFPQNLLQFRLHTFFRKICRYLQFFATFCCQKAYLPKVFDIFHVCSQPVSIIYFRFLSLISRLQPPWAFRPAEQILLPFPTSFSFSITHFNCIQPKKCVYSVSEIPVV